MVKNITTLVETSPTETYAVRVGKLETIADVRRELARLYRAARRTAGEDVDAQSAARLAYLLGCIGRSIETHELECRVDILEKSFGSKR